MLTQIYYALAIIAYSIFLIQFCMAMFGSVDFDTDIDFDGDGVGDMSWNDIFSFKGGIHFLMGFAGWLSMISYTTGAIAWYDYLIAIGLGIGFVYILLKVSKLVLKLRHEPTGQIESDFVGHTGIVTIACDDEPYAYYVSMPDFGGQEIKVYSYKYRYDLGDKIKISSYENGKYFV